MQARTVWKEKMKFTGESGGHSIDLDTKSPLGNDSGLTPKELIAIGAAGCTAMDVIALMKKYKQPVETFEVSVDAPVVEKIQPPIFKEIALTFDVKGKVDKDRLIESVRLSQTKYCAVSAMLYQTVPVHYKIVLNGEEIGTGKASFKEG